MRTQKSLRAQISPEVLEAIAAGTANVDLRAAYRLQLVSAQNEPLRAADVATQTDWVVTSPAEANGQALMF